MLSVALIAALASLFITPPSSALFFEIDWKTLATLFMLLSVLEGFKQENIFNPLLRKTGRISKENPAEHPEYAQDVEENFHNLFLQKV